MPSSSSHVCLRRPCVYCAIERGEDPLEKAPARVLPFRPREALTLSQRLQALPPDRRELVTQLMHAWDQW